jgi:hypothetical protein
VNETDFRKQLLLARIDAHRSIFRLELRSASQSFDPLSKVLGWVGVDRALIDTAMPAFRSLYRNGLPSDLKESGPLIALIVALLVAWVD